MEHVAARVPDDIHAEIQEYLDVNDCSQSEAVREILRRGTEYERYSVNAIRCKTD